MSDQPVTLRLVDSAWSESTDQVRTRLGSEDDPRLMERIRQGEEPALGALLDRYWKSLVTYAVWLLGDRDTAEDMVQEAFVRVWRHRATWQPTGSVQAYLYRIVRNLALQENEKRAVRRRFAAGEVTGSRPEDPAEVLERKRLHASLERAIGSLAPRRREVLVLARFHDHSYGEIAEIMGISVQTVANQMSSALRDLRKAFGKMTA